jgi:hypothetical protein
MSDMTEVRRKRAMASVYVAAEDACWVVTQTPSEVAEALRAASPDDLLELTLGNDSEWNGKPLFVRARSITAISPPRDQGEDDE